ncbi:uncharacterized protein LOC119367148 [Triticum dicoccoides]|uniref:uncharacterized protein LOC119367148 n=1 Tax=Triticum dicoccoides TaxID=85692 RepID=UPI000E7AF657|nr:uncharacterized protein LOC119367148 [Triticum dicoccoides]
MNLHNTCLQEQLSGSNSARPQTFWTSCPACRYRYEYYHEISQKTVRCQNCSKAFVAHVLTDQPVHSGPEQSVWKNAGVFSEIRLIRKFKPGQIWALYSDIDKYPNCYAFIEKVELQNNEVQTRWLEVCPDGELEKISIEDRTVGCGTYKVATTDGIMIYTDMKSFSHRVNAIFTGRRNSYEIYPRKDEVWALLKGWDIGWSSDAHNQKKYKYEVVQVLSDFTTGTSITVMPLVKIKVFVSLFMQSKEATPYLIRQDDTIWFSHCIPYRLMGAAESEGIPEGALELDPAALPLNLEQPHVRVISESRSVKGSEFDAAYAGSSRGNKPRKESEGVGERQHATCMNAGIFAKTSVVENRYHNTPSTVEGMDVAEESDDVQAEVLCPEFFDFDQLRDVSRFRRNQIWAVYDSQCCMPRFYARITKVRRAPKFEVHFVLLEFDPRNKAEVAWSRGELPVACGHFKHGASHTAKETKIFSQIISYEKSRTRNSFEVYPKKGEVWALFKGWDIGWSSDAKNHTDFQYEVVQIVSDFTTSTSIIAMPLVKLRGFVSLFTGLEEATPYVIPQDNTLRFSHCVPYHWMEGTERDGIPEGAVELDPDALPPNLEDAFASVVPESSYTHSAVQDSTDVYEESDDIIQEEYECAESEFHEFTEMRSLDKLKPGQIWALYNDMDKFPNYYAGIRKVDLKNNKVQVRWLYVSPRGEEEKRLVNEDRPVGCGIFTVSGENDAIKTYTGTQSFSHPVCSSPTGREKEFEIIPLPREIWAVYKDWRAGWTAHDFKNCDYELVEILTHTDSSIQVKLLRKVDGHRTVFRREPSVETICKDEYLKFSHQIPRFHLTNEKGGKLRGCLELDPFSVPERFLGIDSV